MVKMQIQTESYDCGGGFAVDVVKERGQYAAWIYHIGYGIKEYMFGAPDDKCEYEEFLENVESNFDLYAKHYAAANLGMGCEEVEEEE